MKNFNKKRKYFLKENWHIEELEKIIDGFQNYFVQQRFNVSIEDTITFGKYNEEFTEVAWETCSLRNWLNNDFYLEAFTSFERSKIQTTHVVNNDNKKYNTQGGKDTEDKIFLLSIDQANQYFKLDKDRIARKIDDNEVWWYWLRSPGNQQSNAVGINGGGIVRYGGNGVDYTRGVRPVMWIKV